MTYEEAFEARVTQHEACRELRAHSITPAFRKEGNAIIDSHTGEFITEVGLDGMFSGREVLEYLGY